MGINTINCDVLIVGGGIAGLQAAVTLHERSPEKTMIIADLGGGASSEIMGFCAPLAPGDSAEIFIADTLRAGAGENDPALVERLCRDAKPMVESLEKIGIDFDKKPDGTYDMLRPVGSSYPRVVHHKTTSGKEIIKKYHEVLPDGTFRKIRIVKLFTTDKKITGALGFENGEPVAINTPCVILATGGAAGLYGFSSWTKALQGTGYALALDAGVELTGMHRVQFEPCVTVYPDNFYGFPIITTLLFEGAKLIDGKGNSLLAPEDPVPAKRGLAELISATIVNGRDCGHGGVWFDFSGVNENNFKQKYPEYYRKLRPLATDYKDLRVEVKPAAHTTLGGVKINPDCSTSIKGLFAAGEVTGGIHGRDRIGGNAGLEVLVFGHAAGITASTLNAETTDITKQCEHFLAGLKTSTGNAKDFLKKLGNILDEYCGMHRTPGSTAEGLQKLNDPGIELEVNPPSSPEDYLLCKMTLDAAKKLLKAKDSL